ncbi:MAG: transglycosylase SLT domain-containing protein [Dysgonamonadaceae bacterium]|nr:transglycosylase SLT domain-containing protein [Dysgonamonadaceae bacterium]
MELNDLKWLIAYTLLLAAIFLIPQKSATDAFFPRDFEEITERGEITVLTVEGADSYFTFKSNPRGYEYQLAKAFADSNRLQLNVRLASSEDELKKMLLTGEGDFIACCIYYENSDIKNLSPCGHKVTDKADSTRVKSWAVRKTVPVFAAVIDKWFADTNLPVPSKRDSFLYEHSKLPGDEPAPLIGNGRISPYDSLFRKYACEIGWDWRLLASISFQESKFHTDLTSSLGASGLMGIIPQTAKSFGLSADSIFNPEANIRTATRLLARINRTFLSIKDAEERQKFAIAAYVSGAGHINDARALAEKYGRNPSLWDDTEEFLKKLSEPEYYNDEVCLFGNFKGKQTIFYLDSVLERWKYYKLIIK